MIGEVKEKKYKKRKIFKNMKNVSKNNNFLERINEKKVKQKFNLKKKTIILFF